ARLYGAGRIASDWYPFGAAGLAAPLSNHPLWHSLDALDHNAKTARVVNDRDLRRRLVEDRPDDDYTRGMATILERTFELGEPLDYEPDFANSIANRARAAGRDPFD